MLEPSLAALIVIVVLALGFGFVNGMNDAANAIATVIGTRTLTPQKAVMLAAVFNLWEPLQALLSQSQLVKEYSPQKPFLFRLLSLRYLL